MPVVKASNFGNPYVGLFSKASERLVCADITASPKLISALESLGAPVLKASIGGAGLSGLFVCMNSNGAVLPSFCSQEEISLFKSHGLNVEVLSGQFSAVGNNLAANDKGAAANPEIPRMELEKISDCLGVEVVPIRIAGYPTVGSCIAATNSGFLAHNRASEQELKELEGIFGVPGSNCTLNTGVPFVSICLAANSKGAVAGESSTGFELGRAAEALRLL
ncbi:MAG: translation initiation factor IF-6 [Candidatus Micrarchaeota archaeon]|nr:translation initiation factor IF-6 [Candidatus Micrarchaeota archaeon]